MKVRTAVIAGVLGWALIAATALGKDNEADKTVDAGSFGVFIGGQRVATETFSIVQNSAGSVVTSEFKSEQATQKAEQSSELKLSPGGEIIHYEWKETSPEKIEAVVEPNNDFLVERTTTKPGDKPAEQPFLLPASTMILDDYFFIQREVLLWKYLSMSCRQDKGKLSCPLNQSTHFGTLNPHAQTSMSTSVQFSGREKVMIHGGEQELSRFEMKSDTGDWSAWLNDQLKVIRIVPGGNTEVVRD